MKMFGANWRTSLSGFILLCSGAIALKPDIVNFLPDNIKGYVIGVATFVVFVSGGTFVVSVKDKQVTGGTVQQTASGAVAKEGTMTLVDETVKASIKSHEPVTPKQRKAVHPDL